MFRSTKMKYIEIALLQRDFQNAIDYLGSFGGVEIKKSEPDANAEHSSYEHQSELLKNIETHLNEIFDYLQLEHTDTNGELADMNAIDEFCTTLAEQIKPYRDKLAVLMQKKSDFQTALSEIERYSRLTISKKKLEQFEYVHFVIGSIKKEELDAVHKALNGRIASYELSDNIYIIFTTKKGRWSLDSELKKTSFQEKTIPGEEDKIPSDVLAKFQADIDNIDKEISELTAVREDTKNKYGELLHKYEMSFNLQKIYFDVYSNIQHSEAITVIEGWVPEKKISELTKGLKDKLGDTFSITTYSPEELPDGLHKSVPVKMENAKLIKPFEMLVGMYGTPQYRTIDPTPFMAVSFLMFFGLMYGDIGQGLVFLFAGIGMMFSKKLKDAGVILASIGVIAVIFGFIYGSCFCFEHEDMEWLIKPINKTLFGLDQGYLIRLDPENAFNIFYLTVGFGVVINLLGLLINIINSIIRGTFVHEMFGGKGIAGFMFLFCVGAVAFCFFVLKLPFSKIPSIFFILAAAALLLIFLSEPIAAILTGHRPIFEKGFGLWFILSVVEVFDVCLSTITNNLSFIRIGAFAFAHSILSFTVISLAKMFGGSVTSVAGIITLIVGNAIIVILEGMIVCIQSIRLEYYEFFSKFFNEQGKTFKPFVVEKNEIPTKS